MIHSSRVALEELPDSSITLANMKSLLVTSIVSCLLLTGCATNSNDAVSSNEPKPFSTSSTTPNAKRTSSPTPTSTPVDPEQSLAPIDGSEGQGSQALRTKVDWASLPAGLQGEIDVETAAANCKSLLSRFGDYPASSPVGKYLTEALALAQCE